jgi:hypothetical protein
MSLSRGVCIGHTDSMEDIPAKSGEIIEAPDEDSPLVCPEHTFDVSIQAESRAQAVMADDVRAINHSLQQVGKAWRVATSVDDVCKLSMTTTKLLTERRRLMLLSLEPDQGKSTRKNFLEPPPREAETDPRYS